MTSFRALVAAWFALAVTAPAVSAQVVTESVDLSAMQKIRDEGLNRSRLDSLALYLPDGIGAGAPHPPPRPPPPPLPPTDVTAAPPTTPRGSGRARGGAAETFGWGGKWKRRAPIT